MKKFFGIFTLFAFVLTIASCTKEDPKSSLASITSFKIAFDGVDDKDVKYDLGNDIKVSVPYQTNLKGLVPTIKVSDNATVSPASGTKVDFEDGVAKPFTVTAEDGVTKKVYNVTITTRGEVGSGKQLKKFVFDESQLSTIIQTYEYAYNDASLVSSYKLTEGETTTTYTFNYNDKNQVTSISSDKVVQKFTYNDAGQISGQEDVVEGKSKFKYVFTYDDKGHLKESVRTDLTQANDSKSKYIQSFEYKDGNAVKEVKGTQVFEATFDDKNNPFAGIFPAAYGKLLAGNSVSALNKNNPLTRTGADDPGITYEYNSDGYPVSSTFVVFGFATIKSTFEYN